MAKVLLLVLCAAAVSAQVPKNPFDKAPPNVEDALRARVMEFYQDHVDGKFRKAEELVAEESKDGFYAANKPDLKSFTIQAIAFSDNYTKAKVTIVGKRMVMFMGLGAPRLMEVPFPSYWKIDGDKWCWYIYNDPNRMTPFGKANGSGGGAGGSVTDPTAGMKLPDVNSVLASVQADRTSVKMPRAANAEEKVTISNSLPGLVTLQLDRASYPGLEVTLDKKELRGGEKAVVTIRSLAKSTFQPSTVAISVQPLNRTIAIQVVY